MISAQFLWGSVLLRGELQIDAKNSNSDIFESDLNMKSGSMPLMEAAGCMPTDAGCRSDSDL